MKTLMGTRLLALGAVGVLSLAACGGSDGGGSADEIVDSIVAEFANDPNLEGAELDESCLRGVVEGLSESDQAAIAASIGTDDDPELSPEVEAAGFAILDCIDFDLGAILDE